MTREEIEDAEGKELADIMSEEEMVELFQTNSVTISTVLGPVVISLNFTKGPLQ